MRAALRRVVLTLVVYGVVAALLVPLLDFLRRGLALPPLFETLGRALIVVGGFAAVAIAAAYPRIARADAGAEPSEDDPPGA